MIKSNPRQSASIRVLKYFAVTRTQIINSKILL